MLSAIHTNKPAARLFLGKCAREGLDIMVLKGRQASLKVAKAILGQLDGPAKKAAGKILEGGGHAEGHLLRDALGNIIGQGASHIQFKRISNRHIFYGSIAALMSWGIASEGQAIESNGDKYTIEVDEVYSNPLPGVSWLSGLTFTYWAGEDSVLSYCDWVNPGDLIATGAEIGREIDRYRFRELIGIILTISKNGSPFMAVTLDKDGNIVSVSEFRDGDVMIAPF
jgi:hypothetical protein